MRTDIDLTGMPRAPLEGSFLRCYRYMSGYWEEALRDCRLKLSAAVDFNDVFDCSGICTGEFSEEAIKAHLGDGFSQLQCGDALLPDIRRRYSECIKDRFLERAMFRLPQILCFSIPETKEADALMWSHYGNKWKGVRLGFDLLFENHRQVTYDTTSPYALSHVRYSKQRPVLDLSKIEDIGEDPLYSRYFYEMVSTKSEAWHYENEWRLFCDEPYSIEENGMRFWKFHNALLQTIDLGPNIDIGQQERLIGFSKEFFPHVAVRKVSMSSSESEYDFKYCPLVDPRIQVQAKSTFKILAPPK